LRDGFSRAALPGFLRESPEINRDLPPIHGQIRAVSGSNPLASIPSNLFKKKQLASLVQ
jgi:hypothetical protein